MFGAKKKETSAIAFHFELAYFCFIKARELFIKSRFGCSVATTEDLKLFEDQGP